MYAFKLYNIFLLVLNFDGEHFIRKQKQKVKNCFNFFPCCLLCLLCPFRFCISTITDRLWLLLQFTVTRTQLIDHNSQCCSWFYQASSLKVMLMVLKFSGESLAFHLFIWYPLMPIYCKTNCGWFFRKTLKHIVGRSCFRSE